MKSIFDYIPVIAEKLKSKYPEINERQQVAWWLLEALTGKNEASLIAQKKFSLTELQEQKLAQWLNDHVNNNKPLQYILGSVPFGSLEILVRPPLLIPRPETEEWCLALLEELKPFHKEHLLILDLCTGTGCIALALAQGLKNSEIIGSDISDEALTLAKENAVHNKITNVTFVKSDLYETIPPIKFDLIVANPPYIAPQEWQSLDPDVTQWEDRNALVAAGNGLAIIEKIIDYAPRYLKTQSILERSHLPQLIIEIGAQQGKAVKDYALHHGFGHAVIEKDLEGKDRVMKARITHG